MNKAIIFGRIGKEPEMRSQVLSFTVATKKVWYSKEGEKQEKTTWHNVSIFGKTAETMVKFLHKGDSVLLEGHIDNQAYEKDGIKKTSSKIIADVVHLIPRGATNTVVKSESEDSFGFDSPTQDSDIPF